jgi:hypothetical protein
MNRRDQQHIQRRLAGTGKELVDLIGVQMGHDGDLERMTKSISRSRRATAMRAAAWEPSLCSNTARAGSGTGWGLAEKNAAGRDQ